MIRKFLLHISSKNNILKLILDLKECHKGLHTLEYSEIIIIIITVDRKKLRNKTTKNYLYCRPVNKI